jgi:hypothetical protein
MRAVSFRGGRLLADVFPRKELIDCLVTTFVSALHTMSREIHAAGLRVLGFDQTVSIFVAHHQQAISAAWAKLSACQHGAAARDDLHADDLLPNG